MWHAVAREGEKGTLHLQGEMDKRERDQWLVIHCTCLTLFSVQCSVQAPVTCEEEEEEEEKKKEQQRREGGAGCRVRDVEVERHFASLTTLFFVCSSLCLFHFVSPQYLKVRQEVLCSLQRRKEWRIRRSQKEQLEGRRKKKKIMHQQHATRRWREREKWINVEWWMRKMR